MVYEAYSKRKGGMRMRWNARLGLALVVLAAGLMGVAVPAQADTFTFTSCHISSSACEGGSVAAPGFGSVTLNQVGTAVTVDVALINGNKFVQTGSGAMELFLFNATSTMTVTGMTATFNGADVTSTLGGLTYVFHAPPGAHADGTGDWTGSIECTISSNCNGNSIVTTVNDLHFTVNNATLAQLETMNDGGNFFVADILCGATQPGCAGGLTGPIDVTATVPEPGSLLFFGPLMALAWMVGVRRWKRQ